MSNPDVGQLLNGSEHRDAIHIAIAPVVAGTGMSPGDHVTFRDDDNRDVVVGCEPALAVGIVDPFLTKELRPGDRFYMFLNPNTITSLRHEWTHPAFKEDDVVVSKAASEAWLRDFCENSDSPSYETLISGLKGEISGDNGYYNSYIDSDYLHFGGHDAHGEIPEEFWRHAEVVTGRRFPVKPSRFSCSC